MAEGYSSAQVRAAEAPHLARREPLMQRAADGLARELRAVLAARPDRRGPGNVLVLVGPGNNGGDALYAAAEISASGSHVNLVLTAGKAHQRGLAVALDDGCGTVRADDPAALAAAVSRADVVVDGILGIGTAEPALRGRPRDVVAAVIEAVRRREVPPVVVAVDLPSGIGPDDGSVPDPTVLRADVTVTFGAIKAGLLLPPGGSYAGRIRLIDIGLGPDLAGVDPLVSV
ncbi:yjeF N-terminal region [Rathayibacter oskolensis]|uniref:NAD(P)H-hydrate epimerase n=1 Tax=Rathayibacter oskolensis TaxID=1891671 RepID=A0A1X7NQ94_9MICO|nr:NAD(P)H-hydrate epimerase [Rathayibacter oskolensis]SMH40273.1 yjeF N-terminal region [Rathayibacter oskolensis]